MAKLNSFKSEISQLKNEQKTMLEMSEQDIKKERLISQEMMFKRNLEWLDDLNNREKNPSNLKF